MVASSILEQVTTSIDSRFVDIFFGGARLDLFDATTLNMGGPDNIFATKVRASDNTINADGTDSGAPPAINTFYYVYWDLTASSLVLCLTAPIRQDDGTWRLDFSAQTRANFLSVGWCQTIDAGAGVVNFADSQTQRFVASRYNRVRRSLFKCPGYNDANSKTTLAALNSAVFAPIHAGVDDFVQAISNGEDAIELAAAFSINAATTAICLCGIGLDSTTSPSAVVGFGALSLASSSVALEAESVSAIGVRKLSLLAMTTAANVTFIADYARTGADADPPATFIAGTVWV